MTDRKPPSIWLAMFKPRQYERDVAEWQREREAENDAYRLAQNLRIARREIALLTKALSPQTRLIKEQALAQWQAHLLSLEDDGVFAIPKGQE